jgi:hypothetical protein
MGNARRLKRKRIKAAKKLGYEQRIDPRLAVAINKLAELEHTIQGLGAIVLSLLVIHGPTTIPKSLLAQVSAGKWRGWQADPTPDGDGVILTPALKEDLSGDTETGAPTEDDCCCDPQGAAEAGDGNVHADGDAAGPTGGSDGDGPSPGGDAEVQDIVV